MPEADLESAWILCLVRTETDYAAKGTAVATFTGNPNANDAFIGSDAEDDVFLFSVANLTSGDRPNGRGGTDTLRLTTSGALATHALAQVTAVERIVLRVKGNDVTLPHAEVGGVGQVAGGGRSRSCALWSRAPRIRALPSMPQNRTRHCSRIGVRGRAVTSDSWIGQAITATCSPLHRRNGATVLDRQPVLRPRPGQDMAPAADRRGSTAPK